MPKTYVLDTNVLIHDPRSLYSFEENTVLITEYVLMELDKIKEGTEEKNQNAREAGRLLRTLTKGLSEKLTAEVQGDKKFVMPTIEIPGTKGKLIILMDDPSNRIKGEYKDDQILGLVAKYRKEFDAPIIVVTKDNLMAIKANGLGFASQDYRRDQARTQIKQFPVLNPKMLPLEELLELSMNSQGVKVDGILAKTYSNGGNEHPILPGYYTVKVEHKDFMVRINKDERVSIIQDTAVMCRTTSGRGIKPKNVEQIAAINALTNPEKTLVCMIGPAGTGKTLLAIASALDQVKKANKTASDGKVNTNELSRKEQKQLRHNQFKGKEDRMQILIARPMVSMGKEMGFLPGDIDEKMRPWIQPILDNLKFLIGEQQANALLDNGTIELQPLQYIRGRSISNAVLIIDEAQNCSQLEVKTIITRAGKNCRIILTGDPDQIDVPYLDRLSNGLTYAADRLFKEDFTAVIPLSKCERSVMAGRAAELL